MFYQVFAIILSESGQWSGYLYNPLLWRRSSITRRCAGSKSSSALGNDISTSRCHHNAIESSSTRNPRALTSTATSATASLTNTCQMRPPPLCFPSVTKLSDIGLKSPPHLKIDPPSWQGTALPHLGAHTQKGR